MYGNYYAFDVSEDAWVCKGVALWYIMYSNLHPRSNVWLTEYLLWLLTGWIISGWPLTCQILLISLTQALIAVQAAVVLIPLTLLADSYVD